MIVDMDMVLANSFEDFHAKGLDYLCLYRSRNRTLKVYFFDNPADVPEVVSPHDHRYDFTTRVLSGSVANHLFDYPYQGETSGLFEAFEYRTPLNGGDGFTHIGRRRLRRISSKSYAPGESYASRASDIHTIEVREPTILELVQFQDVYPVGVPTLTFRPFSATEPPSLEGLYRPMGRAKAEARMAQYFGARVALGEEGLG